VFHGGGEGKKKLASRGSGEPQGKEVKMGEVAYSRNATVPRGTVLGKKKKRGRNPTETRTTHSEPELRKPSGEVKRYIEGVKRGKKSKEGNQGNCLKQRKK